MSRVSISLSGSEPEGSLDDTSGVTVSTSSSGGALQPYMKNLRDNDRARIQRVDTLEGLMRHVDQLRGQYAGEKWSRFFDFLKPVMSWLSGYNTCINSFLQASPPEFVMLWGSMAFVLEVCACHVCLYIPATGPQHHLIEELKTKLLQITTQLHHICEDAIAFFSRHPVVNYIYAIFRPLGDKISPRLQRIRKLLASIELDAQTITRTLHQDELVYEIKRLAPRLTGDVSDHRTMLLSKLPFQNLPAGQNPRFFGREAELTRLEEYLSPGMEPERLSCSCIYGLVGFGKTEIALEFAFRNLDVYDAILWVAAETQAKLLESFSVIARKLNLVDEWSVHHSDQCRDLVWQWLHNFWPPLGHAFKWLLIFDNVTDSSVVSSNWPRTSRGAVLVTCKSWAIASRFSSMAGRKTAAVSVDVFEPRAATMFLLSFLDTEAPTPADEKLASRIAQSVKYHPLALKMVGSYIRRRQNTLAAFLQEHPDFERDFLFHPALEESIDEKDLRHQSTIANVWAKSVQCLDTNTRLLIDMLALLDEDGGTRIKSHLLIQSVVDRSLSPRERSFIFNRLIFYLNTAFPDQADGQPLHSQWERCEELASQVQALFAVYFRHRDDFPDSPILLCEIGVRCAWYAIKIGGQYDAGIKMADQSISLCERALGNGRHPGYSTWFINDMISHHINVKATIEMQKPTVDHGLQLAQRVCDIRTANKRPDGLSSKDEFWIASAKGNLSVSLMALGRAEEAMDIISGLLEREDMKPNVDLYLSNACLCSTIMRRLGTAMEYNTKAMDAVRLLRGQGDDTAQMAICYFYLSGIHRRNGNIDGASTAMKRCLEIRERLMPRHHSTAFAHHQMGAILHVAGNYQESM
ncbi:hypothetical protein B0H67DRAFT_475065 [Lasiosphaeris hirsuta]|uniref:NB-ARC domain-containing protein n=1 Tax=Lasiosphaeris hirsuta TaxID=260670 RepID=A0AA40E8H4_9PEZI|nr:hypothetical protein B0H67DRAFT_475065 [Lasiosphaeris hirsuta]